jgi:hypothetical protein
LALLRWRQHAIADNLAVLDQVLLGSIVPRDAKVIFTGISRGGFPSLRMASERPENTAGVLNFVGGWISLADAWPADELEARAAWHHQRLNEIAVRAKVPTLWIYGSRARRWRIFGVSRKPVSGLEQPAINGPRRCEERCQTAGAATLEAKLGVHRLLTPMCLAEQNIAAQERKLQTRMDGCGRVVPRHHPLGGILDPELTEPGIDTSVGRWNLLAARFANDGESK